MSTEGVRRVAIEGGGVGRGSSGVLVWGANGRYVTLGTDRREEISKLVKDRANTLELLN